MKIEFHILNTSSQQDAWLFVCELVEKRYSDNQSVFIHMNSQQDAEELDRLLWTYREDSFIPHTLASSTIASDTCIIIAWSQDHMTSSYDSYINLSDALPDHYTRANELIEIVVNDPNTQALARERYKQYRPHHHINTIKH